VTGLASERRAIIAALAAAVHADRRACAANASSFDG
jgi:hypothetical protein